MCDINKIQLRCYGANDNLCDKYISNYCEECNGCAEGNEYFEIMDLGDCFTISYHHKTNDLVIERFSERIDKNTLKQT